MRHSLRSAGVLKIAIVLTVVFNVLALVALVHATPMIVTFLMFVGHPLLAMAIVLLVAAVMADLKTKGLL
jgi:hypothetical protein